VGYDDDSISIDVVGHDDDDSGDDGGEVGW
jgi:hypothetical protein